MPLPYRLLSLASLSLAALIPAPVKAEEPMTSHTLTAVPFTQVHLSDAFWAPRLETNRTRTILDVLYKCEETHRISNFSRVGDKLQGKPSKFDGLLFNDSDVYKAIEAAAYSLANHPDPVLDQYLDTIIAQIASAQEPDGYLNCYFTMNDPAKRWTGLRWSHEHYCAGHLIEAGVAHFQATGKRNLLDVAVKFADCIDHNFGPGKRQDPPGHEELELALEKLYRLTGEERYLKLAQFMIDRRGHHEGRESYTDYAQDDKPVTEQREAVGHAVRGAYLYTGVADVARETGDPGLTTAIDAIWGDMVGKKLHLTGGIGSRWEGEAFGAAYELPNGNCYNETCAAIANIFWNERMALLHGDARYADVFELTLYNGFLSGVSLSGDRYFYPNPLASDGHYHRVPWFDCACCPPNVARLFPTIGGYVYAQDAQGIYTNLYIAGQGELTLAGGTKVSLTQKTDYPWSGQIEMTVDPAAPAEFSLNLRLPGWATGAPVPSDLYTYAPGEQAAPVVLKVNGQPVETPVIERGYAVLRRTWQPGDQVSLELPMPVRRVVANPAVKDDAGRTALMRGPIVYCVEAVDVPGNRNRVSNLALPAAAQLVIRHEPALLGGVTVIEGSALARYADIENAFPVQFRAVPYYAWDNRAPGEMAVWLPVDPANARPAAKPTLATESEMAASYCGGADTLGALNDLTEPKASNDMSVPRFTWWPRKGDTQWVEYKFAKPANISKSAVYWFDDTGTGECRVPKAWRLLYEDGSGWHPVTVTGGGEIKVNQFNEITFNPVMAAKLRIEVDLQEGFSSGILEWRVE